MIRPITLLFLIAITVAPLAYGHEFTLVLPATAQRARLARHFTPIENGAIRLKQNAKSCQLRIRLIDAKTKRRLAGLIRISQPAQKEPLKLMELIGRDAGWFVLTSPLRFNVPRGKLQIEAIHGIETDRFVKTVDLTGKESAEITAPLERFYNPREKGLKSGNTHLHIMNLTHAETVRYLREVPRADGLDLVFLSHLRRIPDERNYISNMFTAADLARLSEDDLLLVNGEEHRHNYGRGGEGYGHVMFLDIPRLIRPVSIGPGIMRSGTDGIPLQQGIRTARQDGATVVWCHNTFGREDTPNWLSGLVHAQNIFDGGEHGSYEDSFYRYLNLGFRVPFSTGTDWFVYDFSRVYTPLKGKLTSAAWRKALTQGKSYITNGTFLEFRVEKNSLGDRITLSQPKTLQVRGKALGRNDFGRLELIHNGKVIHSIDSRKTEKGRFVAEMNYKVDVPETGWLALRIPRGIGKNEFNRELFAHTSPIYVEVAGKKQFDHQIAHDLLEEMKTSMRVIEEKSLFADDAEKRKVLSVYRRAIKDLANRAAKLKTVGKER